MISFYCFRNLYYYTKSSLYRLRQGAFYGNLVDLKRGLFKTLHMINEKFHGKYTPTILWSGNGYHIYQPVQLSGPSSCLAHTDIFYELSIDPDRKFIRWAEQYMNDGKADPAHSKGISFKNMLLRIYANENLISNMAADRTIDQAINVATLPGVQKHVIVLPDGHEGYGFPVGGVAAMDLDQERGSGAGGNGIVVVEEV